MTATFKNTIAIILFTSLGLGFATAQEETMRAPKQQIEFRHDNDFVLFTDRYYSTGLFLTYRRALAAGIFPNTKEQLSFQLQQQAYTPSNVDTENILKIDRPYAGFTAFTAGWSIAKNSHLWEVKTVFGLTGPSSGAGRFQRWHHENIVFVSVPTWFTEIEDSFHANLEVRHAMEVELAPIPFGVRLALHTTAAYGTKDIYAQPEVVTYFGRRSPLSSSIAYDQVGSLEREIYFSLRFGYRFVSHNALLQGNILGDDSLYTINPNSKFFRWGLDLYHRFQKNDYRFGYRFISEEAIELKTHQYLFFSYARSF
jgi:hypothetical protein